MINPIMDKSRVLVVKPDSRLRPLFIYFIFQMDKIYWQRLEGQKLKSMQLKLPTNNAAQRAGANLRGSKTVTKQCGPQILCTVLEDFLPTSLRQFHCILISSGSSTFTTPYCGQKQIPQVIQGHSHAPHCSESQRKHRNRIFTLLAATAIGVVTKHLALSICTTPMNTHWDQLGARIADSPPCSVY